MSKFKGDTVFSTLKIEGTSAVGENFPPQARVSPTSFADFTTLCFVLLPHRGLTPGYLRDHDFVQNTVHWGGGELHTFSVLERVL